MGPARRTLPTARKCSINHGQSFLHPLPPGVRIRHTIRALSDVSTTYIPIPGGDDHGGRFGRTRSENDPCLDNELPLIDFFDEPFWLWRCLMFGRVHNERENRATRAPRRQALEGLESRLLFAAGDVDTSFGVNGFAGATFPGHDASAGDIVVDAARGRVLVAGRIDPSSANSRLSLAAFKLNGQSDTSFSGDGKLVT